MITKILWGILITMAALMLVCIIRCIIGPRNTDRLLAVNMLGSIGNAIIAVLATIFDQNFLADVAILYTMLSFAAVVVMSRIIRGVYKEKKEVPHD